MTDYYSVPLTFRAVGEFNIGVNITSVLREVQIDFNTLISLFHIPFFFCKLISESFNVGLRAHYLPPRMNRGWVRAHSMAQVFSHVETKCGLLKY